MRWPLTALIIKDIARWSLIILSLSGTCGRNLSHGLFRCSNKDCQAVHVFLLELLSLFRASKKEFFLSEINTCVALLLRGKICLSCDLTWPVVYLMSTSMFLLLLVDVLCFAQNLHCTTSVSCDLKSSEFKEVCYKTFLRRSSCCIVSWN